MDKVELSSACCAENDDDHLEFPYECESQVAVVFSLLDEMESFGPYRNWKDNVEVRSKHLALHDRVFDALAEISAVRGRFPAQDELISLSYALEAGFSEIMEEGCDMPGFKVWVLTEIDRFPATDTTARGSSLLTRPDHEPLCLMALEASRLGPELQGYLNVKQLVFPVLRCAASLCSMSFGFCVVNTSPFRDSFRNRWFE